MPDKVLAITKYGKEWWISMRWKHGPDCDATNDTSDEPREKWMVPTHEAVIREWIDSGGKNVPSTWCGYKRDKERKKKREKEGEQEDEEEEEGGTEDDRPMDEEEDDQDEEFNPESEEEEEEKARTVSKKRKCRNTKTVAISSHRKLCYDQPTDYVRSLLLRSLVGDRVACQALRQQQLGHVAHQSAVI